MNKNNQNYEKKDAKEVINLMKIKSIQKWEVQYLNSEKTTKIQEYIQKPGCRACVGEKKLSMLWINYLVDITMNEQKLSCDHKSQRQ